MISRKKRTTRRKDLSSVETDEMPFCPIVALGASAGGLETFQQFFDRLPSDTGFAFVLVQHLDPQRDTLMPELLAKHTAMKVQPAENGAKLKANHVYVIPPNAELRIDGCRLRVAPLPPGGDRSVIDCFFCAIAEDQGPGVVGIVLSGTGSDGAAGLRAIKIQGGLTIAQSPETAKFDGMPKSAIASGCVDITLPVAEMPERILQYFRHLEGVRRSKGALSVQNEVSKSLPKFFPLLRKHTGHDFSRYKQSTVIRRIQRRMQVSFLDSVPQYLELLHETPSEVEALFKDLLIGVTQFFRDAESFEALQKSVIPRLFDNKSSKDQVRIWVPGCASGEEAYTFAILLLEHAATLNEKPRLQVFGTDLDAEGLETARKARYPEDIKEQLSPERFERFFKKAGRYYEVIDEVREICVFSPHNLIKDPPFSRLDLLSCRNLLIYLEADAQKKLLPLFHYALNPSGYLFLGPSENIASRSELFRVIDLKHRIFQRKPSVLHSPAHFPVLDSGQVTKFSPAGVSPATIPKEFALARSIERILLEEYAPASVIINGQAEALYFSGNTGKYLEPPSGMPSNKITAMARKNLRLELRTVVHRAITTGKEAVRENLKVKIGRDSQTIDLIARPLTELGPELELYIVLFRELVQSAGDPVLTDSFSVENPVIKQLENELRTTREDLQTTIEELETSNEELKSANEELLSMNEELQSANEELQTSKEEVQSANEELQRKIEEAETAAAELRKAHEDRSRLAAIVQGSEDAIIGTALDGLVTSWNRGAKKVFGFAEDEILNQPISIILPPERQEEEKQILAQVRRGEQVDHYETERVTKEGRRIVVSVTASPIRDAQGVVVGASTIARDITERKQAEEARRHLAAVVESSDDAIITKTLDGIITSWNRTAEKMYGYGASEVIGKSVTVIIPADRPEEEPAIIDRLRRGEKVDHYETVRRRKDGTLIDISLTVSPIRDAQGKVVGASKIARDITGRKQADEARFRLAAVVESSDDAIISKTLQGIVLTWNKGAERIFGYTAPEMLGKHITTLFPPDRLKEEDYVLEHIRRGERLDHFETVRRTKDGRLIDVSLTVSPIKDPLGKVIGASKIARDITEQKRAADTLRSTAANLQLALDAGNLGDWKWDAASDVVTLSQRASDIFGLPRNQPITWAKMREMLHPDDRERARLSVERALETRDQYSIEYRVIRPSGKNCWISAKGRGSYTAKGEVLGMTGVVQDITEKKATEEALRTNEHRLRLFIEHAPAAIAMFDREMRYQAVSRRWMEDYKLEGNLIGRSHYDVFPEMPARWREIHQRALQGEVLSSDEDAFRRADGSTQWIKWEVRPWFESNQMIGGILIAAEDVTSKVLSKQALQKNEEQLRDMANSIPQLAWMAEPNGNIFWYNRRWYEYTGTTLEQMEGWGWQSVHDPKILPTVLERWKQSLNTGEPFDMEFPLRGADGQFRWFLTRVNPMRDETGNVTRWFGTNTDVEQERRTREALREETRVLELLNETGKIISSQLDLQTLLQHVTDAATRLSGAKFGAFFYNVINEQGEAFLLYTLSGAPREAFEKFGLPRATPLFGPTFHGEGVIRIADVLADPRYGQMAPHHGMPKGHLPVRSYLAVPVISRSGEVIGGLFFGHPEIGVFTERSERLIVGVAGQAAVAVDNARLFQTAQREIAERKRVAEDLEKAREDLRSHAANLEKQVASRTSSLQEALAQLEEFSYSVSHDLRAPLRAIAGYNDVFRKDFGSQLPKEGQVYLDKIARSASRMERLVNDVLTMSRIARADLRLHPIQLQEFISDILEQHPSMQEPAASVSVAAPHTVVADEASLAQAVSNILSNAVKFMPTGKKPKVTVRSEQKGERVRLWIDDNGIGVLPQHRSKLFTMFQRLPATIKYEGTGIGLAIVRKAVERMGGTVGMEANEPEGSRFWLELKGTND